MATCLALNCFTSNHSQGSYYRCQVDVLESVTVRRSEHVRHEEDLKGHLALFLSDCSFVSGDYPFLTLQSVALIPR
jgi:hypothetical protein